MKFVSKIALSLIVASSFMFVGCMEADLNNKEMAKAKIDDTSIGLRKVDLFSEDNVVPDKTKYTNVEAGSSKLIVRAFQDAPPMISHTTDDMLPITINNNQCLVCHVPEVAESLNTLPYPKSHLTDFRPKHNFDGVNFKASVDVMKNETSIKELQTLSGSRFNCTLCHAPQGEGQLVENNFEAEFTSKDGETKSNWVGTKLTEGLDTFDQ